MVVRQLSSFAPGASPSKFLAPGLHVFKGLPRLPSCVLHIWHVAEFSDLSTMNKTFVFSAAVPGNRVAVRCSYDNYTYHGMKFDEKTATWSVTLTLSIAIWRYWYYVSFLWSFLWNFLSLSNRNVVRDQRYCYD